MIMGETPVRSGPAAPYRSSMLTLPDTDPGHPPVDRPTSYLGWLARRQWRTLAIGVALGVTWMLSQALAPWAVGRAVDDGVAARSARGLATWCAVLLGLGLLQAGCGAWRHRMAVFNWLQASMRTQQAVAHHVAAAGTAVAARTTTGEVVATVATDAGRIGNIYDVSARFSGAVAAYVVVAALLLGIDLTLGLVVLIGAPVLVWTQTVLIRPLQGRRSRQRSAEGELTALGADTVAGLRVLRGIGGEAQFVARYAARSEQVRAAGVRVARVQAVLDAAQVLIPGSFVVVLTWLGAHAALEHRITAGQLVTLYGYAAFLVQPLGTTTEMITKLVGAWVATARVLAVLRIRPDHEQPAGDVRAMPPTGAALEDPASGLRPSPGAFTALVSATPQDAAALALRLARLDGATRDVPQLGGVPLLGGVPVDRLPVDQLRARVLVAEAEPHLFTGSLRTQVDPGGERDEQELLAALAVADAQDVLDALPEGLDTVLTERGRSLSGGQRQRIALARAVLADPDVLVLIEPTSAVDAHTEARIADRLAAVRRGRTTLVSTASPLLLDRADQVVLLLGGRVVAQGRHRDLLHAEPGYREVVTRGEDE
jgi:ABC-type multidrug transport system fused ATPase/permease subunit